MQMSAQVIELRVADKGAPVQELNPFGWYDGHSFAVLAGRLILDGFVIGRLSAWTPVLGWRLTRSDGLPDIQRPNLHAVVAAWLGGAR